MVRKIDQYIKWKLAKKIGKIILLYLSISLDYRKAVKKKKLHIFRDIVPKNNVRRWILIKDDNSSSKCNFLIWPLPLSPNILSPGSLGIGTGGGGGGGGALLGQSGHPDNKLAIISYWIIDINWGWCCSWFPLSCLH